MSQPETPSSVTALRREVARLRRLVLLVALPWPLLLLASGVADVPDELTARRFVVVDEQGHTRAELAAPSVAVPPTPHAEPVRQALPALRLYFEDGTEILVGGGERQVRVSRGDQRWTGLQSSGFFTVDDYVDGGASAILEPFRFTISREKGELYRAIDLDVSDADDHARITVTEDDDEFVFPGS